MKREIKFRAWHKENKRMYILGWNKLPNSDVFVTLADLFKYGEDAILMQFTGIKDSKGVEIYEGDIILFEIWHGGVECLMAEDEARKENKTINWILPHIILWNNIRTEYEIHSDKSNQTDLPLNCLKQSEIEKIGDIYSNPELL